MEERTSTKLRVAHAAKYLSVSESMLAKMRLRGNGPRYAKIGGRVVIYDRSDLDQWIEDAKRTCTSQAPACSRP